MKYKVEDIINAKGNIDYIDFCGKIEIISITDFDKATQYQEDK